jgi:hypothetical protein
VGSATNSNTTRSKTGKLTGKLSRKANRALRRAEEAKQLSLLERLVMVSGGAEWRLRVKSKNGNCTSLRRGGGAWVSIVSFIRFSLSHSFFVPIFFSFLSYCVVSSSSVLLPCASGFSYLLFIYDAGMATGCGAISLNSVWTALSFSLSLLSAD